MRGGGTRTPAQAGGDNSGDGGDPDPGETDAGGGNANGDAGDRTYGFLIRNEISTEDLDPYPPIDGRPPAEITLSVEARPEGQEEEVEVFRRESQVQPDSERRFERAFTADRDETASVISLELGRFTRYDEFDHRPTNHSAGYRFTTGGFGVPTGSTFLVTVLDTQEEPSLFEPNMGLREPSEWEE